MLTYRASIKHQWQGGKGNCGPIALSCLFEEPLEQIEKIVKCSARGTRTSDVLDGMHKNGIDCSMVTLHDDGINHLWWLEQCSYRWPIYVGGTYVNQGKRGRPSQGHHAVLFANGMIYDGHNLREEPISAIATKVNKNFVVKSVIIFNRELSGWKKNMENSH